MNKLTIKLSPEMIEDIITVYIRTVVFRQDFVKAVKVHTFRDKHTENEIGIKVEVEFIK